MTTRRVTPRDVGSALARGGWTGPATVALATAATAGVLGLLLALLAKPVDFGLANTLALATVIATGAFGADLRVAVASRQGETFFAVAGDAALGGVPLTVTLLALLAGVIVFRRVTRDHTSRLLAVGDAARAAVLLGLCLAVPATVLTADNDELGQGWGRTLSRDVVGYRLDVGADPLAAFWLGFLMLFAALSVIVAVRPGRTRSHVRELLLPSAAGLATLVASLPVAGLVGVLALLPGGGSGGELSVDATRAGVAVALGGLPNAGAWLLSLGAGAPVHGSVHVTDQPGREVGGRLLDVTGSEPGLWVAPVVLVAVLVLTTYVVLRLAGRGHGLPALGVWLMTVAIVVPWLARLASVRFTADLEVGLGGEVEPLRVDAVSGPDEVQTMLLVLLLVVVVAVALVLVGRTGWAPRDPAGCGVRPARGPR